MRRLLLVGVLLIGTLFPGEANAAHRFAHWLQPVPEIEITVIDSLSPGWRNGALDDAIADWNRSARFKLRVVRGANDYRTRAECPVARSGTIRVCNAEYPRRGGVGFRYAPGGHVVASLAYFDTSTYGSRPSYFVVRYLMCHEVGHSLGLGHRTDSSSCMSYTWRRYSPDAHDFAQLKSNQAHRDAIPLQVASARGALTGIEVEWEGVAHSALRRYTVWRRTTLLPEWELLGRLNPGTTLLRDSRAAAGQRNCYRVVAAIAGIANPTSEERCLLYLG